MAAAESCLMVSATASTPAARPSTAARIGVLPLRRGRRPLRSSPGGVDAGASEQPAVADQHRAAVDGGPDALAGDRVECRSPPAGRGRGRVRRRRWRRPGGARCRAPPRPPAPAARRLANPADGEDVGQGRVAGGDGAGLVQHDGVELVRGLQGLGRADQDAGLGALAGADHDRQGGGQAERARAGDDQHRDRGDQGEGERRRWPGE